MKKLEIKSITPVRQVFGVLCMTSVRWLYRLLSAPVSEHYGIAATFMAAKTVEILSRGPDYLHGAAHSNMLILVLIFSDPSMTPLLTAMVQRLASGVRKIMRLPGKLRS